MSENPLLKSFLESNPELEVIDVLLTDVNGIIRGKQCPADSLQSLVTKGINFPASTLFLTSLGEDTSVVNHEPLIGDPDCTFKALPETLKIIPWSNKPAAQMMIHAIDQDGSPHSLDPRSQVISLLEKYAKKGWHPVIALEAEFFLFEADKMPPQPFCGPKGAVPMQGPQVYNLDLAVDAEVIIEDIQNAAKEQDIPLKAIVCEYGQGQFEINLDHSKDILKACDDAMALRRLIRAIARKHGLIASYMAKPMSNDVGSGTHIHMSILDEEGENIFGNPDTGEETLSHAVGGVLAMMAETMALITPFENSFRRHRDAMAGITPMNWGIDHRWVAVRIPRSGAKDKRFEHRIAGADVNPYLLVATVLASSYHGLVNQLDPGVPVPKGKAIPEAPTVPTRWHESIELLKQSSILKDYFDPQFLELYTRQKQDEESKFHEAVTNQDYHFYYPTI